jgi:hypothetical protein
MDAPSPFSQFRRPQADLDARAEAKYSESEGKLAKRDDTQALEMRGLHPVALNTWFRKSE